MVGVERGVTSAEGTGVMKYESRQVKREKCVEFYDGRVEGFEGENHVPNGGSIEASEPRAEASRRPVQDWDVNGVWEPAQEAEK